MSSEDVGVTLYPTDFKPVEMVTEQGEEVLQPDFTDAQLFMHSIQELERVRNEKKDESEEGTKDASVEEEDVIDPRVYYRPVVNELQAATAELHQLINSIDLIRRHEYLEEMRCIRENTAPKPEDLEYLIERKTTQVQDASSILLRGVDSLSSTIGKESVFFQGLSHLLERWKVCAPLHGTIPKPFRAGEPLAVDCSFQSSGSTFQPQTRSIAELSYAELGRTEKGLVRVKKPEEYSPRTLQAQIVATDVNVSGQFTLPSPPLPKLSKEELEKMENKDDDVKVLQEHNAGVLRAVQFSVFCEELFQTLLNGALRDPANMAASHVIDVLDDELQLDIGDNYRLFVRLVDAESVSNANSQVLDANVIGPRSKEQQEAYLAYMSRYCLLLFQQEVRYGHGRKELSRIQLQPTTSTVLDEEALETLPTVLAIVSHALLVDDIARYLDGLSAPLAIQKQGTSTALRIFEDGLGQPICDTQRGVFVSVRWKTCANESTLSAFDLSIGKQFTTEVLVSGTSIRIEEAPSLVRQVSGLSGLKVFVERMVKRQMASALHKDILALGLHQVSVNLDGASIRLFAGEPWDGSCIGEGRVSGVKASGSIFLEPFFQENGTLSVKCLVQSVPTGKLAITSVKNRLTTPLDVLEVEWDSIPGGTDSSKLSWLFHQTQVLPPTMTGSLMKMNGHQESG